MVWERVILKIDQLTTFVRRNHISHGRHFSHYSNNTKVSKIFFINWRVAIFHLKKCIPVTSLVFCLCSNPPKAIAAALTGYLLLTCRIFELMKLTYNGDPSESGDAFRDSRQMVEELGAALGLAVGRDIVDQVGRWLQLERWRKVIELLKSKEDHNNWILLNWRWLNTLL